MAAAARQRILQLTGKAQKPMIKMNYEKRAFLVSLKSTTLVPVKSLRIAFDPFHTKCTSIRNMAYALASPTIRQTNQKCGISVDVKSDLSEPKLEVEFNDGEKAIFKTANLNRVEIVKIFNELCLEKAPSESTSSGLQTKATNTKPKPKKK